MNTTMVPNSIVKAQEQWESDDKLSPAEKTRVISILRAQVAMANDREERRDHGKRVATVNEFARLCNLFHAAYCAQEIPETLDDLEPFTGDAERYLANLALEILGISL